MKHAQMAEEASLNSHHQSEFWKKKGPLLPNTGNKNQAIILVELDQVLKDANLIAEVFNDFFAALQVPLILCLIFHHILVKNHWKNGILKDCFLSNQSA